MSRPALARVLRPLSYVPIMLLVGWLTVDSYRPRGPACPSMSCIGQGLGEAMLAMFALVVAIILGAAFNIASFLKQDSPRSTLRKVELWLFVTPFILALGLVILFILR